MWTLSGFADEISPDLDEQVATLQAEDMQYLELRGVWDKNVAELSDDEVRRVRATLERAGIAVSAIGSPIGKINISDDFEPHYRAFQRVLDIAHQLNAPYIRIFSFFLPQQEDPSQYRNAVLDRLERIVRLAEGTGVTLVHENEKQIYGDTPERCHDLLSSINSPTLRATWDPANFVQCGVRPYPDGYNLLRPFIAYVHVKDARLADGQVVPAGEGDGEVRKTIRALRDSGFDGFFSLEPHLAKAGAFSGFSGPDLFRLATQRFKTVLREEGIHWR
jgi:sugar phosphate isomerase/epimerase